MSSAYSPAPFSYLAAGSQAPKTTGLRKDEGIYGTRMDATKPIPALRHDQPRRAADWSIDHRLRGGELTRTQSELRRPSTHDSSDTESALSHAHSNVRLPRPDVSLYNSQIDRPAVAARSLSPLTDDTPSGFYSNRSPIDLDDVSHVDAALPTSAKSHGGGGGVFDNFILKSPETQTSGADAGARRTEDERPVQKSRLERLFDDHSSSNAAPARKLDSDVSEIHLPRISDNSGFDESGSLPEADHTRTNSFTVTAR